MGLSARNITVHLGAAQALCDISMSLNPGEVTAICGPNGAGKSTLLSVLAGLIAPDAGEVRLDGLILNTMAHEARAKLIGFLPQNGEIAWDVSVHNLTALGRLPHRDRDETAIAKALAKVEMSNFAQRPISTLSGGEKARALLARVLAGEPRWLLTDEPLAALDLAHRDSVIGQLRDEAAAGTGVAIVVHDLAQAMNHADKVVVLDQGKIAAQGTPQTALTPQIIANVWGVKARWIGEAGAQALITRS